MTRNEIGSLIVQTLQPFRPAQSNGVAGRNLPIYGDGSLDSMTLVVFIAELEVRINETTGKEIVLASERAMSRSHSPFHDVDSLTDFVEELLREGVRR